MFLASKLWRKIGIHPWSKLWHHKL